MVYWKNSKPLDIENEIKITLVIKCKYKKMRRYSVKPRDWIFIKGYGYLSFAENMGKNIGKNKK